ncbi:hypothetical protein JTE90_020001 [Oedothorax gibbosus]|uniref:Uncharacterized protein n=1 Tax=Oedothorax gibbosus TaxID=931172 RepID=A0AAV6TD59_9ARAC|nr:hypothetical protein JTE90_020001 [Oedothorax gibbosus]
MQPAIRLCSSNDTPGSFGNQSFGFRGKYVAQKLKLKRHLTEVTTSNGLAVHLTRPANYKARTRRGLTD